MRDTLARADAKNPRRRRENRTSALTNYAETRILKSVVKYTSARTGVRGSCSGPKRHAPVIEAGQPIARRGARRGARVTPS